MDQFTWNSCLAQLASAWANTCVFQHGQPNLAIQNPFPGTGQNVFAALNSQAVPPVNFSLAIYAWYLEKMNFTFATGACVANEDCGHYAQVVWANSSLVGCGYASCTPLQNTGFSGYGFATYIVCNYWAPGNIQGQLQPYIPGAACSACPSYSTGCSGGLCVVPAIPDTCASSPPGTVAPGSVSTEPNLPPNQVGVIVKVSTTTTAATNSQSSSSSSGVFAPLSLGVGIAVIFATFVAFCLLGVLLGCCCRILCASVTAAVPVKTTRSPGVPYTAIY